MLSLAAFLLVLGVLIFVHEFGHFIVAKRLGVRVENFSLGFGRKIYKRKIGDTEYSVSAVPLGGYVKLAGDNIEEYKGEPFEYYSQPIKKRAMIIFCGPLLNYILGFLFFWLIFFVGYPALTTKVGGVLDGFGAQKAGIIKDDRIMAVDGQKVKYWEELQKAIQDKKAETSVVLSVERQGKELSLSVQIKEKKFSDALGKKRSMGMLGIAPGDETIKVRYGFFKAFSLGVANTLDLTSLTYEALWRMITGRLSMKDSVSGPLGIFDITARAARLGIIPLMHLMAVLSISLALFNLLPLPVLDGGHLLFLAIEKIRGRMLSLKAERIVTQAGLTLIIAIGIAVTYNDIVRLYGEKIAGLFK